MKIIALENEINTARPIDFRRSAKALWQLYPEEIMR